MTNFRNQLFAIAESVENIVITSHISPDDDSISSVLSVYTIFTTKYPNKNIKIIYTGEKVSRYKVFHNFDKIQWVDDVANYLEGCELLIGLDGGQFGRFSRNPEVLKKVPNTALIDHHASEPDDSTLAYITPDCSSNSENIFNALGGENFLNKEIAEIFLLGILGDTGNLVYIDSHQTGVFLIVKKLIEVGDIKIDSFLSKYRMIPKRIVPLLQEFVKNTNYVQVDGWPDVQYSFVDREFLGMGNFSDEDMSAASHIYMGQYLCRIEGQTWGFVFSPRGDGGVRMSSRSLHGSVNVRIFSEELGIGGGHDRASGANFKSLDGRDVEVKDCIEKVFDFMKNNAPVLS